jgi:hypothetical protein
MSAHIDTQDLTGELHLWEQARLRRSLVLLELTQRLARQAENDGRLLRKLENARARLTVASEARSREPRRLELAWVS